MKKIFILFILINSLSFAQFEKMYNITVASEEGNTFYIYDKFDKESKEIGNEDYNCISVLKFKNRKEAYNKFCKTIEMISELGLDNLEILNHKVLSNTGYFTANSHNKYLGKMFVSWQANEVRLVGFNNEKAYQNLINYSNGNKILNPAENLYLRFLENGVTYQY
ncbi:hypothetical protein [uncultured Ilyobacter sp.]|uniref:hypothetical protein n=1 Tax=uncultured Ilyobacter sp. TaxID=544433 RepID=UPI0029C8CC41|nr:hypothetical protein [uncultured Ilyobacter sp.]